MTIAATDRRKNAGLTASYRLAVLSRVGAAAIGGYALATVSSILLSHVLPMPKAQAVLTGVLISFAIYTCAIMWVFSVSTATKAWSGLLGATAVCGVLSWMVA
jgi:hypothetical protein